MITQVPYRTLPLNLGSLGYLGATSSSPQATQNAVIYNDAMDRVASPVNQAIAVLRSKTDGYDWTKLIMIGPIFGALFQAPEETRNGIRSALGTLANRMEGLRKRRADVLSGALPIHKWIASVNVVGDGVKGLAKDLSEASVLDELVVAADSAAADVRKILGRILDLPGDIGTGLKWGIPLAVGGAVILAILIGPRLLGGTTVVVGGGRTQGLGGTVRSRRLRRRRRSLFR